MKQWKLLLVITGLSLCVMALAAVSTANAYYGIHNYSNMNLTASGTLNDCYCSSVYSNYYQSINTGFTSASPSGYTLAVGYVYDPADWGSASYSVLTSPGYGPTSGSGPVYGIWGNLGSTTETVQGYIVYNTN